MTSKANLDRIQKCQTKAARMITRKGWEKGKVKDHRQDVLDGLGWQNVRQLVSTSILNLTKNALDGTSSKGLNDMFSVTQHTNPRLAYAPRIAHYGKITATDKMFEVHAPTLYNNLPPQLRCTDIAKNRFKREVRTYIATKWLLPKH